MAVNLRVGTSGYAYKEWKGSFYPAELPDTQMLTHYASKLPTVEINNTFYRMPTAAVLEKWRQQVPETFEFVLKAPQAITHRARLKQVGDALQHFYKVAQSLGSHRGPTLFQLPPYMKKDVPRLKEFLAAVPANERLTIEFRHASWFDDAVYSALQERGAALCLAETDEGQTPRHMTTDWSYVRLRKTSYSEKELRIWNAWLQAQNWKDVYVFFKHEDAGVGPQLAADLVKIATE